MIIVTAKVFDGNYSVIAHSIGVKGSYTWKLIKMKLTGEPKYSTKRRACLALVHKLQPMKGACTSGITYIVPKQEFQNLTGARKWCKKQNERKEE